VVLVIVVLRKKRIILAGLLCAGLVLGLGFFGVRKQAPVMVFSPCRFGDETYIIDPGHGGEDGGAIAISGKTESAVNLEISLRLDPLLHFYGVNTMMTRREDLSLHDESAKTLRQKKISDLHHRVAMIEEVQNATLVSIHQNSYPEQKYRGMQVFYNDQASLPLAQSMQENVRRFLDSTNQRKIMKVPSSVYLMKHITCRAVLVECGFLTNPTDDQLLQDPDYQKRVAIVIAAACLSEKKT